MVLLVIWNNVPRLNKRTEMKNLSILLDEIELKEAMTRPEKSNTNILLLLNNFHGEVK